MIKRLILVRPPFWASPVVPVCVLVVNWVKKSKLIDSIISDEKHPLHRNT